MKDHTLLQAIARVNRPLRRDNDEKIEKTNGSFRFCWNFF